MRECATTPRSNLSKSTYWGLAQGRVEHSPSILRKAQAKARFLGSTLTSPTYPGSRRRRRPPSRPRRRPRSLQPRPSGAWPRPPRSPRRPRPLPAVSVPPAERGPATSSRRPHLRSDSGRLAVAVRAASPSPPARALTGRASSPAASRRRRAVLQFLGGRLSPASVGSPPVAPSAASRRHQQRLWLPRAQLRGQWPVKGRARGLRNPSTPDSGTQTERGAWDPNAQLGIEATSILPTPPPVHLPGRCRWHPRHPRPRRPSVSSLGPFRSHPLPHALRWPKTLPDRRAGSQGCPERHQGGNLRDQGTLLPVLLSRQQGRLPQPSARARLSHRLRLLRDRRPRPAAPQGCTTAPLD